MIDADTIAAIATPPGVAAIAVLRISGARALAIATACFRPRRARTSRPKAGQLRRGWLLDSREGGELDDALAVIFYAPHSYTGEDLVELHVHGGVGIAAAALGSVLHAGARLAAPGEFTKRAFLHSRMDLAQAEAVADLITAETTLSARAAAQRLRGSVGRTLQAMSEELVARLVEIEAHVDYPDEVPAPDEQRLARCVAAQRAQVASLLRGASAARALRDGIDCVIAGPPNAGKSSLLNALAQAERAIVSSVPGTTRDIIEERVAVEGVVLRLRDTAGLRETSEPIEAEGVARARTAVAAAELVLVVIDGSKPLTNDDREVLALTRSLPRVLVCNKLDLGDVGEEALRRESGAALGDQRQQIFVAGSVLDSQTISEVRKAIGRLGWGGMVPDAQTALVANSRQIEALTRASEALNHAARTCEQRLPVDLLSGDLRVAAASYGEITGATVTAEIIDGIFSRFCVGK
ncbi:MAG TPA: tRNA uridine-5-carboxymethylaminomethyl(34) synthesis GTPase MnmE [Candidatus Eremiobacteraceae bacterium]|nr:tRNA uridine-5-carboxymethylaminomethyl(34) synthesis GTPase MnmE [Candidatus Eremiobacteraceae bacterium]